MPHEVAACSTHKGARTTCGVTVNAAQHSDHALRALGFRRARGCSFTLRCSATNPGSLLNIASTPSTPLCPNPIPNGPRSRQVDIYNHVGRSLNVAYMYGAYENAVQVQLVMELCTGAWVGRCAVRMRVLRDRCSWRVVHW